MNGDIERLQFDDPIRVPPHHLDAEAAVLGSAFLDREVVGRVAGFLQPRDFYRDRHGTIFAAMLALHERSEPIDPLTVQVELERVGKLDDVGGLFYLGGLVEAVPTPIHAERYAQVVADAAVLRRLISAGVRIAGLPYQGEHDATSALEKAEQILQEVDGRRSRRSYALLADLLREYLDQLRVLQDADAAPDQFGVPTGYRDLDRVLMGGLQRANLVLLAARPGMGKSALSLAIAEHAARRFGAGVLIFSLEMAGHELVGRLLSMQSGIETTRLRSGRLTERESLKFGDAIGKLAELPIVIDDSPLLPVSEIRSTVRRVAVERQIDLVIVDHLQIVRGATRDGRQQNRVQELSDISSQLKALAREQNVPVLALSQLSRAVEQRNPKIPTLADLRESGGLEQDADVVVFIYRDDYYQKDSPKQGLADLHIAKHRNGPTGQVSLLFNARTTTFLDIDPYRD